MLINCSFFFLFFIMLRLLFFPLFSTFLYIYSFQPFDWNFSSNLYKEARSNSITLPRQCPEQPVFENGQVLPGSNKIGSIRVVNCNNGFSIDGSQHAIIHCQTSFRWSNPGKCGKYCLESPKVSNGFISSGTNKPGDKREILCKQGFTLIGASLINCSTEGQWSKPGSCEPTKCPLEIPQVGNGNISSGSEVPGSIRFVSCQPGYSLQGANSITCSSSGQWSTPGTCSQSWAIFFINVSTKTLEIRF